MNLILLAAIPALAAAQTPCPSPPVSVSPVAEATAGQAREVVRHAPGQLPTSGFTPQSRMCNFGGGSGTQQIVSLRVDPRQGWQIRAVNNPRIPARDHACGTDFGGSTMEELLGGGDSSLVSHGASTTRAAGALASCQPVAATNGSFYDSNTQRATGFLWTQSETAGGSILGDFADNRADPAHPDANQAVSLVVMDAQGAQGPFNIATAPCASPPAHRTGRRARPAMCVTLGDLSHIPEASRSAFSAGMTQEAFLTALRATYPTMFLAMQLRNPLSDRSGVTPQYRCDHAHPSGWACQRTTRTLLCLQADGQTSLLAVGSGASSNGIVYYEDVANAIHPGGSCDMGCVTSFSLDGGMSTQVGFRPQGTGDPVVPMRTGGQNPTAHCPDARTVANYLAVCAP